jgi:phosphate starvation-inducible PhoH-like protein
MWAKRRIACASHPLEPSFRAPFPYWSGRRSFRPLSKKALEITPNLEPLFGTRDENLRLLEDKLRVRIDLRSDAVHVEGPEEGVDCVERIFADFEQLRRSGVLLQNGELNGLLKLVTCDPAVSLRGLVETGKQRSNGGIKRMVQPRSINQRRYVEAIEQADMVFGIGPAGTGKTYLAVAMAAAALLAKKVSRIILVRPAVEAGERLGFLPGSLQEKVDPYLRPLYDALYDLLEQERVDKMLERNVIEIAPLAFMRGRTLNDAFIIMDEAQNTTSEQMKMFLTRMGNNAKAIITGDITQIDLPNPRRSGLVEAMEVLKGVDGIRMIHFEDGDVVRHHLVQRIIRAYDSFGRSQQEELPLGLVGEAGAMASTQPQ